MATLRIALVVFAAAALGGACGGDPTGTQEARSNVFNLAGPNRLEQDLSIAIDPEQFRIPGRHTLVMTSVIKNKAAVAVRLASRMCRFMDADFESTAALDRVDQVATCGAVQQLRDLAPGESTAPLTQRFLVQSGRGSYRLAVRHALDPEFRTEGSFQIP